MRESTAHGPNVYAGLSGGSNDAVLQVRLGVSVGEGSVSRDAGHACWVRLVGNGAYKWRGLPSGGVERPRPLLPLHYSYAYGCVGERRRSREGGDGGDGGDQGLTLVHFSAQLEPCVSQGNTLNTLDTP
jgi:hypothetical protein